MNSTQSIFKTAIVLMATFIFSLSCGSDQELLDLVQEQQEPTIERPDLSVSTHSAFEIPDIVSSFKTKIEDRKQQLQLKDGEEAFWVDEESGVAVVDEEGNATYSFVMHVRNGNENSVYNLVLNRRLDGNHSPDFVMQYNFEGQDILEYSLSQEQLFQGTIDYYSFETFLQGLALIAKDPDVAEPCDQLPVYYGSGSGGPGGGGSNFYTNYSYGVVNNQTPGWGSFGFYGVGVGNYGYYEAAAGCFCKELPNPEENPDLKNYTSGKGNDCPRGEMVIAVNATSSLLSKAPRVKYPKDLAALYARLYPKLTEYLKNKLPTIQNNATIVNALKKYTNMNDEQVKNTLDWGKGPELVIKDLGTYNGQPIYGHFEKPNILEIDIDLINQLENSQPGSQISENVLFFVAVTILHEAVHYGDYTYNNDFYQGNQHPYEEGWLFEEEAYGGSIEIGVDGSITILPFN